MLTRLLQRCTYPECSVLTMGNLCVKHDLPVVRTFVRGRPWSPEAAAQWARRTAAEALEPVGAVAREAGLAPLAAPIAAPPA